MSAIALPLGSRLALMKDVGKQQIRSDISHYLEDTDRGPKVIDHLILRGGVESDPDGRETAWDELGRMVAAFEGW